jgi:hypothetical protein
MKSRRQGFVLMIAAASVFGMCGVSFAGQTRQQQRQQRNQQQAVANAIGVAATVTGTQNALRGLSTLTDAATGAVNGAVNGAINGANAGNRTRRVTVDPARVASQKKRMNAFIRERVGSLQKLESYRKLKGN